VIGDQHEPDTAAVLADLGALDRSGERLRVIAGAAGGLVRHG
jgi:hypothetical protein